MFKFIRFVPAAVLFAILFQACDFNHGLGLSPSKITGKVFHIERPDFSDTSSARIEVDEVRVVAAAQFPPTGVGDIFFSNAVKFDRDTADYEIIVPYGNYPAIAVLWKPRGRDWALESLLGFYGFDPLTFQASLKGVELTARAPVAANVNMFALWGFAQFDALVEGDLTFLGAWPEDTEIVVLGGFNQVPDLNNLLPYLLTLGGINFTLPKDVADAHYEIAVRNGDYKFLGLFWKGRNINWDKIRCIGFYPAPNNPQQPGQFTLPPKGGISGINFTADFNTLPEGVKIGGGR